VCCEVSEDLFDPGRILWTEWWPEPRAPRAAVSSDRFRALLGAVRTLGRLESVEAFERSPLDTAQNPGDRS